MRFLQTFHDKISAERIQAFLLTQNVDSKIVPEENNFELWVVHYDDFSKADSCLKEFLHNPDAVQYDEAVAQAKIHREHREKQYREWKKNTQFKFSLKQARLTLVLIVISIFVSLITLLGKNTDPVKFLYITNYTVEGGYIYWSRYLPEILHGQIWRLFTPVFLHFGILHIVFNMMWLKDLGSIIEIKHNVWYFLWLTLALAAVSNLGQFFMSGPLFGGMSGVVYGYLGFLWLRGHFDPHYRLLLNKQVVVMMIVWLVLCLTGLMGPIANTAHVAGLSAGMLWGYVSSKHWKRFLRS